MRNTLYALAAVAAALLGYCSQARAAEPACSEYTVLLSNEQVKFTEHATPFREMTERIGKGRPLFGVVVANVTA